MLGKLALVLLVRDLEAGARSGAAGGLATSPESQCKRCTQADTASTSNKALPPASLQSKAQTAPGVPGPPRRRQMQQAPLVPRSQALHPLARPRFCHECCRARGFAPRRSAAEDGPLLHGEDHVIHDESQVEGAKVVHEQARNAGRDSRAPCSSSADGRPIPGIERKQSAVAKQNLAHGGSGLDTKHE